MNIKLTLSYDGTSYMGWQIQKKHPSQKNPKYSTIQNTLSVTLEKTYKQTIKLTAESRTDSGVHAKAQVVNFIAPFYIAEKSLEKALNRLLPNAIRVISAENVDDSFDARRNAQSKIYIYRIWNNPILSPFVRHALWVPHPLNIETMRKAARYFIGKKDFRPFTTTQEKRLSTVTEIYRIKIFKKNNMIYIGIHGRSFLHKMVRFIVGALIEVSKGSWKYSNITETFKKGRRTHFLKTAASSGLFLKKVRY